MGDFEIWYSITRVAGSQQMLNHQSCRFSTNVKYFCDGPLLRLIFSEPPDDGLQAGHQKQNNPVTQYKPNENQPTAQSPITAAAYRI